MAIFRQGISNSNPSNFKRSSENFSPLQENLRELNSQIKAFRVTDIVLDENHPEFKTVGEYNGIGAIFYEEVNSPLTDSESKNSFALPYDSQLKTYPLINEIVLVFFLPSQRIGEVSSAKQYFYLKPLNLWNHPHHDAYPNLSIENQNLNQSQDYISTTNGSIRRVEDGSTEINLNSPKNESQNTFVEKVDIKPLMPFMGDSLMEGRYGQSIRFGSTAKSKSLINNNWSESGENGDPITIIRNGQPEKLSDDRGWVPITENINKDLSSIYLTSKQKIKDFQISSKTFSSYSTPPKLPSDYELPQIILNSDNILIQSKKDNILINSKNSISLSSIKSVNVDSPSTIIQSSNILLGDKGAIERGVKGDTLYNKLDIVLSSLITLVKVLEVQQLWPGGLPSPDGGTLTVASNVKSQLQQELNTLKDILSKNVKTT
jgi:hypothetical protein